MSNGIWMPPGQDPEARLVWLKRVAHLPEPRAKVADAIKDGERMVIEHRRELEEEARREREREEDERAEAAAARAAEEERRSAEKAAARANPENWATALRYKATTLVQHLNQANDLVRRGYATLAIDKVWPQAYDAEADLCETIAEMKLALSEQQVRSVPGLASKPVAYSSGDAEANALKGMLADYVLRPADRCATLRSQTTGNSSRGRSPK